MADHPAPVLITGASRGIGEATARLFAQKGHPVALLARSVAAIESLAHEIGGLAIPCDVTDEVAVRQAIHKSAAEFGGIGIVINNAGTLAPAARILDTDPKDWTRNIEPSGGSSRPECRVNRELSQRNRRARRSVQCRG